MTTDGVPPNTPSGTEHTCLGFLPGFKFQAIFQHSICLFQVTPRLDFHASGRDFPPAEMTLMMSAGMAHYVCEFSDRVLIIRGSIWKNDDHNGRW